MSMPRQEQPFHLSQITLVAAIALSLFVLVSAAWNIKNLRTQIISLATTAAQNNWNKDQIFRRWATRHGGLYVKPDDRTPPNPYLNHLPNRDVVTTDGVKLTLMNPAYMMRQMTQEYEKDYGVKGKITGKILLNPINKADAWELASLNKFELGVKEVVEQTDINGLAHLRLMRPMFMTKGCVKCHGHLGFKNGDLRGGVSVSIPLEPYFAASKKSENAILTSHGTVWVIGLFSIFLISKRSQKSQSWIRQLSRTVEQSPFMVFITDINAHIVYVNPKFQHMTGYSEEDVMGKKPSFLASGQTSNEAYTDLWQTILDGKDWSSEILDKRKDGSLFWAKINISPVRDAMGKVTHFVSMHEASQSAKRLKLKSRLPPNKPWSPTGPNLIYWPT